MRILHFTWSDLGDHLEEESSGPSVGFGFSGDGGEEGGFAELFRGHEGIVF